MSIHEGFHLHTNEAFIIYWQKTKKRGLVKYYLSWWSYVLVCLITSIGISIYYYAKAPLMNTNKQLANYMIGRLLEAVILMVLIITLCGALCEIKYRFLKKRMPELFG